MLRALLVFLAGALVGANVVYFLMTRGQGCDCTAQTSAAASPATATPAPATPAPAETMTARTTPEWPEAPPPPPSQASTEPQAPDPEPTPESRSALPPGRLLVPVRGIDAADLVDTFDDARGADRVHEALDIMAPAGTPVLAATDGTVEKLFDSDNGGLTIYQFDPARTHSYYYAHLQRYAPGLAEGDTVRRGQVIGYVGSTGNASPDAPHLHFGIFRLGPEKEWWRGTPLNPYPLLRGR